jgi:hypothetical protein
VARAEPLRAIVKRHRERGQARQPGGGLAQRGLKLLQRHARRDVEGEVVYERAAAEEERAALGVAGVGADIELGRLGGERDGAGPLAADGAQRQRGLQVADVLADLFWFGGLGFEGRGG